MTLTVQVLVTSSGKYLVMFTLFAGLFCRMDIIPRTVEVKLWLYDSLFVSPL